MSRFVLIFVIAYGCGLLWGCADKRGTPIAPASSVQYAVKVHEFEGCECNSVCPCVFSSDTTYGDCRGITVYVFAKGTYGKTVLKDLPCVLVFTWAGKNMEATMGKWKGVVYIPDTATAPQREAIQRLLRVMLGDAFATLDQRTAPIRIEGNGDVHDLTIGTVARLRIHGIKRQNGEPAKIVNAPSPLVYPVMYCALADVNRYQDGNTSWSFTGRNGFYADFDLTNAR